MKVYIAGAITNEPNYRALFLDGAIEIAQQGFMPVLPIELPHDHDKSWESYMKECLSCLIYCDAIYLLRNWKTSPGARIEKKLAEVLGIKIMMQ